MKNLSFLLNVSTLFRSSKVFLLLLFLLNSCGKDNLHNDLASKEAFISSIDCSETPPIVDGALLHKEMREELFAIHDLYYTGELASADQFLEYYHAIDPAYTLSESSATEIKNELLQYQFLGSVAFFNYWHSKGNIGAVHKDYLNALIANMEAFFTQGNSPELQQSLAFFDQQITIVNTNAALCPMEQADLQELLNILKGFAEYTYAFIPDQIPSATSSASFRACDVTWEMLLCLVIEGAIVATISSIIPHKDAWAPPAMGALLVIINYIDLMINNDVLYTPCCNILFGLPELDCNRAENIHAYAKDCNLFDLRAFGSGEDIVAWRWENINTEPSDTVTSLPNLRVSVPNQTDASIIQVYGICEDGFEGEVREDIWDLIALQDAPPPVNWWAIAPPNSASVSSTFEHQVACVEGSSDQIEVSWSASFGGGVVQDPDYSYQAKVIFWAAGEVTIKVRTKNICTGETHTLSKKVNVN